jgi:hypothetical protein
MPDAWELGPHVREDPLGNVTRWQAVAFSDTVKRTCAKCNSGWMHDLEVRSQPIVTLLIYGEEISLDDLQVRTLAFWLAKTFMMLSLAHRGPIVPGAHFRELYTAQAAPRQCLLSIGLTDVWRQEIIDIHHPLHLPQLTATGSPSNAYGISMRIGKFIAHALGHTVPNATLYPDVTLPGVMTEIWPSVRQITWPPALTIADSDSDLVVRMFPDAWPGDAGIPPNVSGSLLKVATESNH